ncbi:MAG: FliH/SctL family protein [Gaiella sp.]
MTGETYAFPSLETGPVATTAASAATRAAELVAAAEARAAGIERDAGERGFQAGLEAGRAEALAGLAPAAASLADAIGQLLSASDEQEALLEREAIELALALAQKIVASVLDVDPSRVLDVVKGVLRGITERERIVIEVCPEDLDLVRDAAADVTAGLGGFGRVEVVGERRVPRGGCVVHTREGEIDGTVETQLARAGEVVRTALQREP